MAVATEAKFSWEVLARELSRLPHVRRVLVDSAGDRVSVWTIVDDFSLSARKAIYAVQRQLIAEYRRFVRFDFHVLPGDETTEISHTHPLVTQ